MTAPFDIAEVSRYPAPGMNLPVAARFSPDGNYVAWLASPDSSRTRKLYVHRIADQQTSMLEVPTSGVTEEDLSADEKLRRERSRDLSIGVTTFRWLALGARLLVPLAGRVWVHDLADGSWQTPWDTEGREVIDPRVDDTGSKLAFCSGGELFVCDPQCRRISPPSETAITHGLADYIAQEELGRSHGFWWSPDGSHIAFTTVDESLVPEFRIPAPASSDPYAGETHRFPFPGNTNARTTLRVAELDTGTVVECDLADAEYLARVRWSSRHLLVQTLDRRQHRLDVVGFDVDGFERSVLWSETSEAWVDIHECLRDIGDGTYLWASERSGFRHLERRSSDGSLVTELTNGEWMVCDVAGVDAATAKAWFSATRDGVLERQLYSVHLETGEIERVTAGPGIHRVEVDATHGRFIDLHHNVNTAPTVTLRDLRTGERLATLHDETDERVEALRLEAPQLRTVSNGDSTVLHVAMYMPDGPGPFPTVMAPYGGPGEGAQRVLDSWRLTADLEAQWLARNGVAVVVVDNRGTWGRGRRFYEAINRKMGTVDVEDQVDVVDALVAEGIVDKDRVAMTGWSYGGYLTLMCLARRPDVFKAGVAGAPVTDWLRYDTAYTERYMDLPDDDSGAYEESSVLSHVHNLDSKVLLVAGLIDENVHFRHTAALLDAFAKHDVDYDLIAYPGERHLPRDPATRINLDRRTTSFLLESLEVEAQ